MEVAGLVLGTVPLLLAALNQYSQGFDTLRSMAKYRLTFSEIVVSFRTSVSIYTYDCEDLLSQRLMLSDDQYRNLMENKEKWDDSVVEKLEYALGKSTCDLYKQLLLHLNHKMDKLHKRLELGPDGSVPFIKDGIINEKECKEFFRGWKRIKGLSLASRIEKYKKLVTEIEADINKIHELTTRAVAAEDRFRPQKTKEIPQYWLDMWQHTSALFINLSSLWSDNCSAPHTHHVQLMVGFPGREKNEEGTPKFQLSFALQGHQQANSLPWAHRTATMISEMHSTLCVSKPTGGKKAVRFTIENTALEKQPCSSKARISNFCSALTTYTGCCLGILKHQDRIYHVHDVEDAKPQNLSILQDLIDRKEVLWQRKRCDLALALAYAVLQLEKTPWLCSNWDLRDIHFSESGTHHHLWIAKSFCPEASPTRNEGKAKKQSIIKNDSLFALGVALLELACGRPLSSFQTDDDLDENGNQHELTRYFIANRLTKKLHDEDGPNFASAVSSGIDPVSETREFDLANDGFRKRYFKDVILPLQEDYDQLFKGKA